MATPKYLLFMPGEELKLVLPGEVTSWSHPVGTIFHCTGTGQWFRRRNVRDHIEWIHMDPKEVSPEMRLAALLHQ